MQNHERFMRLALHEAEDALLAGEFPVGCVLVSEGLVLARRHRVNSTAGVVNELDHAEAAALRQLVAAQPGTDFGQVVAYTTMEPCLMCYSTMLLSGIRHIVYGYEDVMGGATALELARLAPLYRQMQVSVIPHVLREESLTLFKRFFSDPAAAYWRDSQLASYTLGQPGGRFIE